MIDASEGGTGTNNISHRAHGMLLLAYVRRLNVNTIPQKSTSLMSVSASKRAFSILHGCWRYHGAFFLALSIASLPDLFLL
jgi:hypothetical protein